MEAVDFTSWIAGWTALAFVIAYGVVIVVSSGRARRGRDRIAQRVVVTGTRGKSGTVRLIHAALSHNNIAAFAKITGTAASELNTDGSETPTKRIGPPTTSEMSASIIRAAKQDTAVGVFESMAISPKLIQLVVAQMVRPQIVVIPTIRLDHLEEEGNDELQIGMSILSAARDCDTVVSAVSQPELQAAFREFASEHDLDLRFVSATDETPKVPGHHPTNVALALEVATLLGLTPEAALAGMHEVSIEPRAQTFDRIQRSDGRADSIGCRNTSKAEVWDGTKTTGRGPGGPSEAQVPRASEIPATG